MNFWKNKRVLVTGGHGFLGSFVVQRLQSQSATVFAPTRAQFDLRRKADIASLYATTAPEVVIHLAASVGGLAANIANPGLFFYDNLKMGMEMLEVGREHGLHKFVQMGSACEYPQESSVPMREDDLWSGLSRKDKRALRHCQKGTARSRTSVSGTVRNAGHSFAFDQSLRTGRRL